MSWWRRFWYAPVDLRVVALLRVTFGTLIGLSFLLQAPFVDLWWGDDGLVPPDVARGMLHPAEPSLLFLLPSSPLVLRACWALVLLHAALLVVGWWPRVQAACLFVWIVSFQNRNLAILDGEDGVMRLVTFLMVFLPLADRWSLHTAAGWAPPDPATRPRWALQLVRIQVAFVLFASGLEKLPGKAWRDGTALQKVMHLDDLYGRLPVPDVLERSLLASQVMSWGTLALELLVPILVWFPRTRRAALAVAIAFHLALDWAMHLVLFEWLMIAAWLTHLRWDEDLGWLGRAAPAEAPVEDPGASDAA